MAEKIIWKMFETAYLTDEQVKMFQSDFRYAAEYFVGNRKYKEGIILDFDCPLEKMKHMEDVIALLNALTNSRQFDKISYISDSERGKKTMLTFMLDDLERKAEINAESKVEKKFIMKGKIEGAIQAYDEMGVLPSEIEKKIMNKFNLSEQEAEDYVKKTLNLKLA